MNNDARVSFDIALIMAAQADAEQELRKIPAPAELKDMYPDTSTWDKAVFDTLYKRHTIWKRALIVMAILVSVLISALAVSADFRNAVYTMLQRFLPTEMQLTYQVEGEAVNSLPSGYRDHYVPEGFESDRSQQIDLDTMFYHGYDGKQDGVSVFYTVECAVIQNEGQEYWFDNEHTIYTSVQIGDSEATLGTGVTLSGQDCYTLIWEASGITHTIIGNISLEELMTIAKNIY